MKRILFYSATLLTMVACGRGNDFDATGTFEATEVVVSAEAAGRILSFDAEEGDAVQAGRQIGAIDTVQLYLQKLQLERQRASVISNRPDIRKQAAALREQIAKQEIERSRVVNLLKDGAATTKQLDDIDASLKVLNGQLEALLSTLGNNTAAIDENSSALELQIAQIEDRLMKSRIASPISGTVLAKYSEQGELAAVGRPLMKVADMENVYLRAYFTSDQLSSLTGGDRYGGFRRGRTDRLSGTHHVDRIGERIYAQEHPDQKLSGKSGLCREDRREERRTAEAGTLRRSETA